MIVRVNGNSVDGCGADQRIIGHHVPCGSVAATVCGFPHPAANCSDVSHDAAIDGCSWIDGNRVHTARGLCVIKAPGTTGHPFRLRTERGKAGSAKGIRISNVELEMLSKWDATWHARMLGGGRAHPSRVEAPGRIGQPIIPVLFQLRQTSSLILHLGAWHRHVTRGLVGTPRRNVSPARTVRTAQRAAPTRKNRQGDSEKTKCESE